MNCSLSRLKNQHVRLGPHTAVTNALEKVIAVIKILLFIKAHTF